MNETKAVATKNKLLRIYAVLAAVFSAIFLLIFLLAKFVANLNF
jgi:hypothetical protein